eukprot:7732_1
MDIKNILYLPTNTPTKVPTNVPTNTPTKVPTKVPTDVPTNAPTNVPTNAATNTPTNTPTDAPTNTPTNVPANSPTNVPANAPTPECLSLEINVINDKGIFDKSVFDGIYTQNAIESQFDAPLWEVVQDPHNQNVRYYGGQWIIHGRGYNVLSYESNARFVPWEDMSAEWHYSKGNPTQVFQVWITCIDSYSPTAAQTSLLTPTNAPTNMPTNSSINSPTKPTTSPANSQMLSHSYTPTRSPMQKSVGYKISLCT